MKNLKRVFSMALATVMLMGTLVVANAADFTDGEDITHTEAVNTMAALNIINGKPDGSYDPEGVVTRAEMAKMITVALNGGVDPVLGTQTTPKFTDIGGHWAQKYIEYCANLGIINGRGDGTFNPEGTVTGTEAAKMVLVAMGYDATIFNFTGADWAINVNTEANNATPNKLYAGILGIDPSKGLSRDDAAQLIFNGVQDHMMTKSPDMSITSGEITWKYGKSGNTILNTKYDAHVYTAVVTSNEYAGVSGSSKTGEFKIYAFLEDDEEIGRHMTVKGTVPLELLGKSVKIIVANTKTNGVYNTVYGDPMLADINNIYTVSANVASEDAMKSTAFREAVEAEGINVSSIYNTQGSGNNISYGPDVYVNYNKSVARFTDLDAVKAATKNGKIIEIIDFDGDSYVDYIMISAPAIGQVTAYDEKGNSGKGYITVANKNTVTTTDSSLAGKKFEDVIGVEDVAKDDFVSYIQLGSTYFVTKLESVTDVVSKKIGNNKIVVAGETYKNSELVNKYDKDGNKADLKAATNVGDEATLYLDACGYVVCAVAPEAATSYVFLTAIESVGDITGVKARAVFTDGSKAVITITSIKDGATTYSLDSSSNKLTAYVSDGVDGSGDPIGTIRPATFNGQIFKYSESDGEYSLTVVNEAKTAESAVSGIIQGTATLGTGITADSETIFLVKSGSTYTPYIGIANVPTMKTGVTAYVAQGRTAAATPAANGVAEFVVVTAGSPSVTKSIYVLDRQIKVELNDAGKKIYTVPALVDGEYNEALQLTIADGDTSLTVVPGLYSGDLVALKNGKVDKAELNGTGESTSTGSTKFYGNATALTEVKNGNVKGLVLGGKVTTTAVDTLTITNDTKFIIIEGTEAGDINVEGTVSDLAYDKDNTANNSRIVMVRANNTSGEAGYGQAAIIYIVR